MSVAEKIRAMIDGQLEGEEVTLAGEKLVIPFPEATAVAPIMKDVSELSEAGEENIIDENMAYRAIAACVPGCENEQEAFALTRLSGGAELTSACLRLVFGQGDEDDTLDPT